MPMPPDLHFFLFPIPKTAPHLHEHWLCCCRLGRRLRGLTAGVQTGAYCCWERAQHLRKPQQARQPARGQHGAAQITVDERGAQDMACAARNACISKPCSKVTCFARGAARPTKHMPCQRRGIGNSKSHRDQKTAVESGIETYCMRCLTSRRTAYEDLVCGLHRAWSKCRQALRQIGQWPIARDDGLRSVTRHCDHRQPAMLDLLDCLIYKLIWALA
jgi:hypothetical protein